MADVAWRYVPKEPTDHFYGVPARDLTLDEFSALSDDQRAAVATGGLYEQVVHTGPTTRRRRTPVAEGEAVVEPEPPKDGE